MLGFGLAVELAEDPPILVFSCYTVADRSKRSPEPKVHFCSTSGAAALWPRLGAINDKKCTYIVVTKRPSLWPKCTYTDKMIVRSNSNTSRISIRKRATCFLQQNLHNAAASASWPCRGVMTTARARLLRLRQHPFLCCKNTCGAEWHIKTQTTWSPNRIATIDGWVIEGFVSRFATTKVNGRPSSVLHPSCVLLLRPSSSLTNRYNFLCM